MKGWKNATESKIFGSTMDGKDGKEVFILLRKANPDEVSGGYVRPSADLVQAIDLVLT
jgi:hypothetical protein